MQSFVIKGGISYYSPLHIYHSMYHCVVVQFRCFISFSYLKFSFKPRKAFILLLRPHFIREQDTVCNSNKTTTQAMLKRVFWFAWVSRTKRHRSSIESFHLKFFFILSVHHAQTQKKSGSSTIDLIMNGEYIRRVVRYDLMFKKQHAKCKLYHNEKQKLMTSEIAICSRCIFTTLK